MDPEYQQLHERFVSNHNGTSSEEILLVGSPVHANLLLLVGLSKWLGLQFMSFSGVLMESLVICLPPLLCLTVLADQAGIVSGLLVLIGLLVLLLSQRSGKSEGRTSDLRVGDRAMYITNYRASMIMITTICILAVDFPLFPRRFAKTETFGYGLMDIGVGSFVFAAGLVSPEARQVKKSFTRNVSSCLPLLLLGLTRLVTLTLSGYHTNVTEYGVHWNFFFSLAAVRLLSSILLPLFSTHPRHAWSGAIGLAVLYEGFLSFGVADWVLSDAARDNLVSANREGICSSFGYLAIYLAGVAWGGELFEGSRGTVGGMISSSRLLGVWSLLMWGSLVYSSTFFLPPSRRLSNYTFFTWIIAYNLTLLWGFLMLDLLTIYWDELGINFFKELVNSRPTKSHNKIKPNLKTSKVLKVTPATDPPQRSIGKVYRCPRLYEAISDNGLAFFLLANLGTGLVNMNVSTLTTDTWPALSILSAYLASLSSVACMLHRASVKLKFW